MCQLTGICRPQNIWISKFVILHKLKGLFVAITLTIWLHYMEELHSRRRGHIRSWRHQTLGQQFLCALCLWYTRPAFNRGFSMRLPPATIPTNKSLLLHTNKKGSHRLKPDHCDVKVPFPLSGINKLAELHLAFGK